MSEAPREGDREILRWAGGQDEPPILPYYAVRGLEALGESDTSWRARLETLSRAEDSFLRLQATGALVRRGDEARLPEIVRTAATAEDACVRGEAVQVLGSLDAARHLDLFRCALWEEAPGFVPSELEDEEPEEARTPIAPCLPAAEEAALALARLGTPEALTELLHGFLRLSNPYARGAVEEHLEVFIARLDGQERAFESWPWSGWRQWRFGHFP